MSQMKHKLVNNTVKYTLVNKFKKMSYSLFLCIGWGDQRRDVSSIDASTS